MFLVRESPLVFLGHTWGHLSRPRSPLRLLGRRRTREGRSRDLVTTGTSRVSSYQSSRRYKDL